MFVLDGSYGGVVVAIVSGGKGGSGEMLRGTIIVELELQSVSLTLDLDHQDRPFTLEQSQVDFMRPDRVRPDFDGNTANEHGRTRLALSADAEADRHLRSFAAEVDLGLFGTRPFCGSQQGEALRLE